MSPILSEVSLVAILDAAKEDFLRSERSLIQTAGRAARNINGEVIMYADHVTESMKKAIGETDRRRRIQEEYNQKHGITPATIYKSVQEIMKTTAVADERAAPVVKEPKVDYISQMDGEEKITWLEGQMRQAAANLEFEKAAELRDQIEQVKQSQPETAPPRRKGRRSSSRRS